MMDQSPTPQKNNTLMIGILIFAAIALVSVGAMAMQKKSEPATMAPSEAPAAMMSTQPSSMTATTTEYKNGTYTATGEYISPGGPETVGITLTLEENIITDVTFDSQAERPNSVKFQGEFGDNYKPMVMGKNINDIKLDKVAGSSLTPKGFMDALEKVKAQAQS